MSYTVLFLSNALLFQVIREAFLVRLLFPLSVSDPYLTGLHHLTVIGILSSIAIVWHHGMGNAEPSTFPSAFLTLTPAMVEGNSKIFYRDTSTI